MFETYARLYCIITGSSCCVLNTLFFYIDDEPVTPNTKDCDKLLLFNDNTMAFCDSKFYRVCEIQLDVDADRYIKVWIVDPFAGYHEYRQLPQPDHDYVI